MQPCRAIDADAAEQARTRQSQLTKPAGSLGMLESVAIQLAGLQGTPFPQIERIWISVYAADHGVAEESVSAYPQVVTGEMVRNFASGGAAISVLARALKAHLEVVHLGTVNDCGPIAGVRREWISASTANFTVASAMQESELRQAMNAGLDSIISARRENSDLFIGGEMGIANTTVASALACALLKAAPTELVGAGTGVDTAGVAHKANVVARALSFHAGMLEAPWEILRRIGGFEIAALAGSMIAAAQHGIAILVDGFIATVAALAAVSINPACRDWMLFAHRSAELGHQRVLHALRARALLDLDLRLGEGSGAALAAPLLQLACTLHAKMASFAQAGVSTRA
ncbi:MAG: nicotinate-nucleotide--dimethylbenzimidazole phosphoribosyltransferase [Tahibacter sp.]